MSKKNKVVMSDIDTLNNLHRKTVAARERLNTQIAAEVERTHQKTEPIAATKRLAESKENLFKCRMGLPLKFDKQSGEYFYASAGNGRENYRILVTESKTTVIEVAAMTKTEAMDVARKMANSKSKKIKWEKKTSVVDVGIDCTSGSLPD